MRDVVLFVGRLLFSSVFLWFGVAHLTKTEGSAQYAAYKKLPSPKLMVQISGIAMIAGGLAVVLGIWMDLAALCLAVVVLIMALVFHRFWEETDPQTKQVETAQFWKNIAIAGAGLAIAALGFRSSWTITDGVFKP